MIVVGASLAIMYNADVLLGALAAWLGRVRWLAPVLKLSIAYPLRSRFRTGVTLAMFTLVVFTLVVGAITTTSFVSAFNDLRSYGGGFDVRATVAAAAPIRDIQAALKRAPGIEPANFRVVSSQSSRGLARARDAARAGGRRRDRRPAAIHVRRSGGA
jgi:putative ABC transport system permease protein